MKNTSQQIDKFILDRIHMSASELSKLIFAEFGEKYTDAGIRTRKHRLKNKSVEAENAEPELPKTPRTGLEMRGDHIVINWTTRTIITELGQFGEIVCSFDMHKAVQVAYTTMGEGKTASDVARDFDFPHAKAVLLYAKHHGFTKSSLPQTDIEFEEGLSVEEAVEQNIQTMKRDAYKKTEKAKWAEIMKGYEKWTQFHNTVLKPFENHIEQYINVRQPIKYNVPKMESKHYNVVVGMTDLHYLKLAVDDFGTIVYDKEIARKKLFETQKDLIAQIALYGKPEKFTVISGSDGIHIDNPLQTTTQGTNLANSTDGEWHIEIGNYIDMQLDYIDLFSNIAPVDVIIVPGNHSKNTDYLVGAFLKKYYEKIDKSVNVIQGMNSERTFVPFGEKICLVFQHGDNVSPNKMDKEIHKVIMSEAYRWGIKSTETIFYHFSGHIHHEDSKDLGGNVIRITLPAVCPPDKWHTQSQYVGTQLQTLNTLIDKVLGRFATWYI